MVPPGFARNAYMRVWPLGYLTIQTSGRHDDRAAVGLDPWHCGATYRAEALGMATSRYSVIADAFRVGQPVDLRSGCKKICRMSGASVFLAARAVTQKERIKSALYLEPDGAALA